MNTASHTRGHSIAIEDVLRYENEDVVHSFCSAFNVSQEEASSIFQEMLKFLWLCHISDDRSLGHVDTPIVIIDEMWHTFILFTREYHDFCAQHFGYYLHHAPTTKDEKTRMREYLARHGNAELIEEKRQRYNRIYDILGRETFVKWFHEYPDTYSPENIKALRLK